MNISINKGAVVVTSIASPNAVLRKLAEAAALRGVKFIVIGDSKSPRDFDLPGCDFYSLERQRSLSLDFAGLCHERSYTRKNIGYLLSIAAGAEFIVETDDDNFPKEGFWDDRNCMVTGNFLAGEKWLNAYAYFSDTSIYPRGFPIERVRSAVGNLPPRAETRTVPCPIQQGLADNNPDVDAIYRMLFPLPVNFHQAPPVILAAQTWCPFNSQNTTIFREAFALLYLPTFCSFRMTDIWRSFVAQRILWTCGWNVSFHSATVDQDRNEHDLLKDFADEVPGYLNNAAIARALDSLELAPGPEAINANLKLCYLELIKGGWIHEKEIVLLDTWLKDLQAVTGQRG